MLLMQAMVGQPKVCSAGILDLVPAVCHAGANALRLGCSIRQHGPSARDLRGMSQSSCSDMNNLTPAWQLQSACRTALETSDC